MLRRSLNIVIYKNVKMKCKCKKNRNSIAISYGLIRKNICCICSIAHGVNVVYYWILYDITPMRSWVRSNADCQNSLQNNVQLRSQLTKLTDHFIIMSCSSSNHGAYWHSKKHQELPKSNTNRPKKSTL